MKNDFLGLNNFILRLIIYVVVLSLLTGCAITHFENEQNMSNFKSDYIDSNGMIHVYLYGIPERIETPSRNMIEYMEYYKDSNHLIVSINAKEFVHANVTEKLWNDFKNADSYGSFYSNNLKGNKKYWVVGYDGENGDKIIMNFILD